MPKALTHRLAIFLLKDGLPSPGDAVDEAGARTEAVSCGAVAATLYYKRANARPPHWAKFFTGDPVHAQLLGLQVASNGAVMIVPAGGRHFALAWGMGRHMLVPGSYEDNFGLRVTLNSLDSDQIRSIDHVSFDAHTLHQRAQSSRAGNHSDFHVDVDQNLVKSLTGIPSDKSLAVKMTGVEALTISVQTDRSALPDLLARYLDLYNSTAYQTDFAWVDHLRPVLDQTQLDGLDAALIAKLRANDLDRLWLAVPDILEQDDIEDFSYKPGKRAKHFPETSLPDFLATIDEPDDMDVAMLRRRHVYGHRSSVPGEPKSWVLYRCLYCEIDSGSDTCLLYDGKWYRLTRDFVQSINAQVQTFVASSTLPGFDRALHGAEGPYNEAAAAAQPNYLLFDRRVIFHGGSSNQIELCDLLGLDRRLVHVKQHGSSATFSHLFNQGEVSARLLLEDKAFREKVIAKLTGPHQALIDVDGIKPSEFTVVFAVISDSARPIETALPFFSRITFAGVGKRMRNYGYNVELVKVEVVMAAAQAAVATRASMAVQPNAVASLAPAP